MKIARLLESVIKQIKIIISKKCKSRYSNVLAAISAADDSNIMSGERTEEGDKLRDGPCTKPYMDLESCAADKDVKSHRVRVESCVGKCK